MRRNSVEKSQNHFSNSSNKNFLKKTGAFFSKVFHIFDNKLTVMIVPHEKGKVINFQTNVFAMVLAILVIAGILFSFIFFSIGLSCGINFVMKTIIFCRQQKDSRHHFHSHLHFLESKQNQAEQILISETVI